MSRSSQITGHIIIALMLVTTMGLQSLWRAQAGGTPSLRMSPPHAATNVDGPLLVTVGDARSHRTALLAVPLNGQAPHIVLTGLPTETAIGPSPRGRYLALAEDARGLWLARSDGTGLSRRLSAPPSSSPHTHHLIVSAVAWSPDRYTLAYVVTEELVPTGGQGPVPYEQDPRGGVWVVRYDGGSSRHVATFAQLAYELGGVSWSSDGRRIAVNSNGAVVVIDAATGQIKRGIAQGAGAFAPTAPMLAYIASGGACKSKVSQSSGGTAICAADIDGRHPRMIGQDMTRGGDPSAGAQATGPSWAPGGESVAYLWQPVSAMSRRVEIHIMDVSTGRVHVLRLNARWETGLRDGLAWTHVRM